MTICKLTISSVLLVRDGPSSLCSPFQLYSVYRLKVFKSSTHPYILLFQTMKAKYNIMVIFGICRAKMNSANSVYELQSYKYSAVRQCKHYGHYNIKWFAPPPLGRSWECRLFLRLQLINRVCTVHFSPTYAKYYHKHYT